MIIDVHKPRSRYFLLPTVAEILRSYVSKDDGKSQITLNDLKGLDDYGRVIVGTGEGSLDRLLDRDYSVDSLSLIERMDKNHDPKLIVLPPEYRIDLGQAQNIVAYSEKSLVLLDSMAVKKRLLGESAPDGPLSKKRKRQERWEPEKVIRTAFELLHEKKTKVIENKFSSYAWWGSDRHRRIVSAYRAIQGAELRAFQNYSAYKLIRPMLRKESRTGIRLKDGTVIGEEGLSNIREKLVRYDKYIRSNNLQGILNSMDVTIDDMIHAIGEPFAQGTGRIMRTPSRTLQRRFYEFKVTSIPALDTGDETAYSMVWDNRGYCSCRDKAFRSDRRIREAGTGQDEDFACAHFIGSMHTLRKMHDKKDREIPFLPYMIPLKGMMDFVEQLRYNTIILVHSESTGRWTKRRLNNTEMENLIIKKVITDGYDSCFTADMDAVRRQHYNPDMELIKFKI